MRVCQFDGCENSLAGMRFNTKYCCQEHQNKACQATWYEANRERKRAYQATYLEANREERKAYHKTWYKANKDDPEFREKNKLREKAYRESNSEKLKAYGKVYRQRPEAKVLRRIREQKRDAKEKALPSMFTLENWEHALEYFEWSCAYCGKASDELQQDHFIPLIKGGPYTPDNIIPACPACNYGKQASDPEDWCTYEQYERILTYLIKETENDY